MVLLGDLFHLPIQFHLLYYASALGASVAVRLVILLSISCIVAFELCFPHQTARTTPTPWRDAALLRSEVNNFEY